MAVAGQLLLGGSWPIRVIGPARSDLGLARYAIPATAGIAATLFGRLIPGGLSLLLVPIVAVLLWSVTYLELRLERGTGGRTIGDLMLTGILFCGAAGILVPVRARGRGRRRSCWWPPWRCPLALRASEARETMGVEGVGQALLQVLVVVQVGAGVVLLNLPYHVMAALIAFAFYMWGSARRHAAWRASGRERCRRIRALLLIGLLVGLFMHRP